MTTPRNVEEAEEITFKIDHLEDESSGEMINNHFVSGTP